MQRLLRHAIMRGSSNLLKVHATDGNFLKSQTIKILQALFDWPGFDKASFFMFFP